MVACTNFDSDFSIFHHEYVMRTNVRCEKGT